MILDPVAIFYMAVLVGAAVGLWLFLNRRTLW
jgi:hypothetical protein